MRNFRIKKSIEKSNSFHEVYKNLEYVHFQDEGGSTIILAYFGKKTKPSVYSYVKNEEQLAEYVQRLKKRADREESEKALRKVSKAKGKLEWTEKLTVGVILYTSWGYDQTNVSFFQVVGRPTKHKVEFREIAANIKESSFLSGTKSARRDDFIGDVKCSIISENGINCEYGYKGYLVDNDDMGIYYSWGR